jgi:hypothetical protein
MEWNVGDDDHHGMNVTAVEVVSGSTHSLTAKAHWIDRPNQFDCFSAGRYGRGCFWPFTV